MLHGVPDRLDLSDDLVPKRDRSLKWRLPPDHCGVQIARCNGDWPYERLACPLQLRLWSILPLQLAWLQEYQLPHGSLPSQCRSTSVGSIGDQLRAEYATYRRFHLPANRFSGECTIPPPP
jgi:hypothetical protein